MEEWKEYKLGEIARPIKDRIDTSILDKTSYISTENMLPNKTGITSSSGVPLGNAIRFQEGDVLISNIRPYFKKIWRADNVGGCSADVICLRATDKVEPLYLFYLLSQDVFFDYVMQGAKGTKMPRGDRNQIMQWPVFLPSKHKQKETSSLLKSLDDKIECNRRINDNLPWTLWMAHVVLLLSKLKNDNLEQQAKALFKSWFVDFEPFKDGEFVESELGMIPKGWKVGKLGELCQFKRGKNLLSKDAVDGGIPVVAGGLDPSCYHNVSNTKSPVVTVSGSGANAGFMRMYHQEVWASDCSFIDSTCDNLLFVYCFLATHRRLLRHAQTGAVQPHVKPADIHDFDIVIPPADVIVDFQKVIAPSIQTKGKNEQESRRLAQLRDTLLPKLMSGELKTTM